MSAGKFTTTFYEMSSDFGGYVLKARVQPETLAATIDGVANAGHAGPATAPGSATTSQGRRSAGVNMRYVTLEFTGSLPDGYSGDDVKIPVMTPTTFAAWADGKTGTYLGVPVKVKTRMGETVK